MTLKLSLANAPGSGKCPPHLWRFRARFDGKATSKICKKCGAIDRATHNTSFYNRT